MLRTVIGMTDDVLYIVGLFLLLAKCGINRWWALVPVVNNYKLAQCADREEYGKIWCITAFLAGGLSIVSDFLNTGLPFTINNTAQMIIIFLTLFMWVINLIYSIRVYSSLCEMFSKKKCWVAILIFFDGLPIFLWGISKKTVPQYQVEGAVKKEKEGTVFESGITVEQTDSGLSINLKTRSVKSFLKSKVLLRDIHMNIPTGRMVLLLGGSGAGKTTFLNAITGYEQADAEILLNGTNVYTRYDKMKYEIGFVPQQDLIRYNDTVIKTLSDAARLRLPNSMKNKEKRARINEVLDIFGLTPVKNNIVAKQSGGQKKRISIATEFISDPSLFILDEPDSGLDGILAKDLMRRLHEISRQGKIVIVITHTPDRVIDLFDDVIVLAKDENRTGRLVFYGGVQEAKRFFGKDTMEDILRMINRKEEGGEGMADELIRKYAEVCNGR